MRNPQPLTSAQVLDIFRHKTAPAFAVALKLGALYADGVRSQSQSGTGDAPLDADSYEEIETALGVYSDALGIAYQIRDDLSDLGAGGESNDIEGLRPSLLLAIAYERAQGDKKALLETLWRRLPQTGLAPGQVESLYTELKADERARTLLETYKEEAIRSLRDLQNANLKGLLRRVIGRIFNDTEIKGWCKEFEAKNAADRLPDAVPGTIVRPVV
jgi:geranylgeranyl pyrophosphate synthase